jgi:hypothetical protein
MPRTAHLLLPCLMAVLVGLSAVGQQNPLQPAKLTAEQQEQLKLRNRLISEANKLESEGKLAEARAKAQKCLAIEQEVFGDNHPDVAESLEWVLPRQGSSSK